MVKIYEENVTFTFGLKKLVLKVSAYHYDNTMSFIFLGKYGIYFRTRIVKIDHIIYGLALLP